MVREARLFVYRYGGIDIGRDTQPDRDHHATRLPVPGHLGIRRGGAPDKRAEADRVQSEDEGWRAALNYTEPSPELVLRGRESAMLYAQQVDA